MKLIVVKKSLSLSLSLFTGEVISADQNTGDWKEDARPFDNFILSICFTIGKYVIMIGSYTGLVRIV